MGRFLLLVMLTGAAWCCYAWDQANQHESAGSRSACVSDDDPSCYRAAVESEGSCSHHGDCSVGCSGGEVEARCLPRSEIGRKPNYLSGAKACRDLQFREYDLYCGCLPERARCGRMTKSYFSSAERRNPSAG